jgi:hypothetical protein
VESRVEDGGEELGLVALADGAFPQILHGQHTQALALPVQPRARWVGVRQFGWRSATMETICRRARPGPIVHCQCFSESSGVALFKARDGLFGV